MKGRKISFLAINLLTYKVFTQIPLVFMGISKSASGLTALYSGVVSFAVILGLSVLVFRQKGQFFDVSKRTFGKAGKYIVVLFILLYLLTAGVFALKNAAKLVSFISFPTSPLYLVSFFLLMGAFFGALGGEYSVTKLHSFFVPIVLAILALVVFPTILRGNPERAVPVFGPGGEAVFGKGLLGMIMYSDVLLLFLIKEGKKDEKTFKKVLLRSTLLSVLINTLVVLSFNLSLPLWASDEGQLPIYLLMKEVYYGRFFQRVDAILLMGAAFSFMLYLALNMFLFGETVKKGLNMGKRKPVILGYGITLLVMVTALEKMREEPLRWALFIVAAFLLLVTLITFVFSLRRKKNEVK